MNLYNILRYMFAGLHIFGGICAGKLILKNRDESDGLDFIIAIVIVSLMYVTMGFGYIIGHSYTIFIEGCLDIWIGVYGLRKGKKILNKLFSSSFIILAISIMVLETIYVNFIKG